MSAGLSIHTSPTSPAAHGAASARLHVQDRAPRRPDEPVGRRERAVRRAGHPASGLGEPVGVEDVRRARPAADALPQRGGQGRRAAVDPLERAAARRAGHPERETPHRGHRGEEGDPVLVDDRAQAEQQIGPEGRRDEERLAGEPREEAVADEPVAEVGRQQAQRAGVGREAELAPQRAPAGGQRGVGVHHALGHAARSGGEEHERVARPGAPRPPADRHADRRAGASRSRRAPSTPGGSARAIAPPVASSTTEKRGATVSTRRSSSTRVRVGSTGTATAPGSPDRQELGEELEPVAEVQRAPGHRGGARGADSGRRGPRPRASRPARPTCRPVNGSVSWPTVSRTRASS